MGEQSNGTPNTDGQITYYSIAESPMGPLLLTSNGKALTGLFMTEHKHGPVGGIPLARWGVGSANHGSGRWIEDNSVRPFAEARDQLARFFAGTLTTFDLPLSMEGTDFQRKVWDMLQDIPYGTTTTYGELARQLSVRNGSRAVGLANGHNPISIIVPCHRVIGSNGKLTGYGGGLPRKAALLDFEFSVKLNGPSAFPLIED